MNDTGSAQVVGGGAASIDDILFVDALVGDGKGRVLRRERLFGGNVATALVAAARAGADCSFLGYLSGDPSAQDLTDFLRKERVDLSHATMTDATRAIHSVIVVGTDGRRFIAFDDDVPVGLPPDLDLDLVTQAKVLIVDEYGMDGAIRAVRAARGAGVEVVADVERLGDPRARELAELSNHLVIPMAVAEPLTGHTSPEQAIAALWHDDRSVVVVTDGANGAWYRAREDAAGEVHHHPADAVEVVDTTGCGDVFHGVYAAQLALGASPAQCVAAASTAAAACATHAGGIGPPLSGATTAPVRGFTLHNKKEMQ